LCVMKGGVEEGQQGNHTLKCTVISVIPTIRKGIRGLPVGSTGKNSPDVYTYLDCIQYDRSSPIERLILHVYKHQGHLVDLSHSPSATVQSPNTVKYEIVL